MLESPRLLVVNGPNLNLLGTREPELYGHATLEDVEQAVRRRAVTHAMEVDFFQSNHEGAILDRLQDSRGVASGIVINPAGLGPVSISLLDCALAVNLPVVEVHITNVFARESFRRTSFLATMARAVLAGGGVDVYCFAVDILAATIRSAASDTPI
jgi:3-dehydroquinate dehydratase-2